MSVDVYLNIDGTEEFVQAMQRFDVALQEKVGSGCIIGRSG